MAWALMTLDYDIKPTEAEIEDSIERMLTLFHKEGHPEVVIQRDKEDTIHIECHHYNQYPIEKIASCIGGDEWGWIPLGHKIADGNWKDFDGWLDEDLDEFDGDLDEFIK